MKRRSLIVNSVATSIGTAVLEGASAASLKLRESPEPARHLGVHMSVWAALADRAGTVLLDVAAAFCGAKTAAGDYRFHLQAADKPPQERSWRLHAESPAVLSTASSNAVLLCPSRLAERSGELAVLRVKGVASAGGVALYHCDGNAGPAVLLLPAPDVPPKLLGFALNEQ